MGQSFTNWIAVAGIGLMSAMGTSCSNKKDHLPPFHPQPGSLEFCIVANDVDDADAITVVDAEFELAEKDSSKQAELKRLAEAGKPPPGPKQSGDWHFSFKGRDTTFRWVELDPNAVKDLRLDGENPENHLAQEVATARESGKIAIVKYGFEKSRIAIWSRACINQSLSDEERATKKVDYFILIRNAQPGKELTEAQLVDFAPGLDRFNSRPIAVGRLSKEGGERLFELSTENMREEDHIRYLSIIIQGRVFSMPSIRGAMKDEFQISGMFTDEYVKELVHRIRLAGQ